MVFSSWQIIPKGFVLRKGETSSGHLEARFPVDMPPRIKGLVEAGTPGRAWENDRAKIKFPVIGVYFVARATKIAQHSPVR